eukprot:PITA_02449
MSHFRALYRYDALSFADLVFVDSRAPRDKDWIQESQDILKALTDNLQTNQNQQKMYVDRHRVERHLEVIRQIGEVAYELELPPRSKVHNVFHVSCLKKVLGQHVTATTELPSLDDEGHLVLEPEDALETRERRLMSLIIKEYFVRRKNLPNEDATWEGQHILQHLALQLLRDKQHLGGEDYDFPSN